MDPDAKNRIMVCGTVQRQDGVPVSKALVELHELAKDTPDDVVANRYELAETDEKGRFVLRSDTGRQYWLSIHHAAGCEDLTMAELESKRLPTTFQRSAVEGECESKIKLSLDNQCDLKPQ
jgi:hypothetical protein